MDWMEVVNQVVISILPILQTAVTAAIVWVLTVAVKFINKKVNIIDEEKEAIVEAKVLDALEVGVTIVADKVVKELKAASKDGKLTLAEAKAASKEALKIAADLLKDKGINLLDRYKGDALEYLISFLVEKLKLPKNG